MTEIIAEERGGFAAASPNLTTQARLDWSRLSESERAKLDSLFAKPKKVRANHYYHLTRIGPDGTQETDAEDADVPGILIENLKSTLK